jgi:hypothetical protein
MKTKIVNHIARNALHALQKAQGEAMNLRDKSIQLFADTTNAGPGLDLAVLREQMEEAAKLIALLT